MTIPNPEVQRAPVQREPGSERAEGTGFQVDQSWSQGQKGQCLFSTIPLIRLTGLHAPFSAEKDFRGHNDVTRLP